MAEKQKTPLKKLRESRGLTQAAVAAAIGMPQSTFAKIEGGETPQADSAERIAKYFGSAISEAMILWPERFPDYEVGQR